MLVPREPHSLSYTTGKFLIRNTVFSVHVQTNNGLYFNVERIFSKQLHYGIYLKTADYCVKFNAGMNQRCPY